MVISLAAVQLARPLRVECDVVGPSSGGAKRDPVATRYFHADPNPDAQARRKGLGIVSAPMIPSEL